MSSVSVLDELRQSIAWQIKVACNAEPDDFSYDDAVAAGKRTNAAIVAVQRWAQEMRPISKSQQKRYREQQPPCPHPWETVGINADGNPWCTLCLETLIKDPPWPDHLETRNE
jgi:hypothetical protein